MTQVCVVLANGGDALATALTAHPYLLSVRQESMKGRRPTSSQDP